MTKILYFILLFLAVIGLLGVISYTLYDGVWPISVGLLAAAHLAWPRFKGLFVELTQ